MVVFERATDSQNEGRIPKRLDNSPQVARRERKTRQCDKTWRGASDAEYRVVRRKGLGILYVHDVQEGNPHCRYMQDTDSVAAILREGVLGGNISEITSFTATTVPREERMVPRCRNAHHICREVHFRCAYQQLPASSLFGRFRSR